MKSALLVVFDYHTRPGLSYLDTPFPLLAMSLDLQRVYLLTQKLKISPEKITILTDLEGDFAFASASKVIRAPYPSIEAVITCLSSLAGQDGPGEAFLYISGHGAQIGYEVKDGFTDIDNALVLEKESPQGLVKRYLKDNELFKLLFEAPQSVPIFERTGPSYSPSYVSKESLEVNRTPGSGETRFLCLFDTCHSGTMVDFHFVYDPFKGKMVRTRKEPWHNYPGCVCLSAAEDTEEALSTSNGSPFTKSVCEILSKSRAAISIRQLNSSFSSHLSPEALNKRPTISATVESPDYPLPFFGNGKVAKSDENLPRKWQPLAKPPLGLAPEQHKMRILEIV